MCGAFLLLLILTGALSACASKSAGQVILQKNGQTVIYTREEYDRLIANGIDPHDALSPASTQTVAKSESWTGTDRFADRTKSAGSTSSGTAKTGTKQSASSQVIAEPSLNVVPSEVAQVRYVKVSEPNGYFTCEAPAGWKVVIGLKGSGIVDLLSYAITIYDPEHPDRQLYYALNSLSVKSEEASTWYKTYGGSPIYQYIAVTPKPTTEGFFAGCAGIYGYRNFSVTENLGKNPLGGNTLVATAIP